MALPNLPQPDTTTDGKTSSRWMFLLWQWVNQIAGNNQQTVIQTQTFLPPPVPVNPSLLTSNSQIELGVQSFAPRPIPYRISLNACDTQSILAGQIFGS